MSWPSPPKPLAGPLAGVRVLDLSRILAGPYAAALLADFGADVIKIERPDGGDETRRWGPPFVGDTAAYFYFANRSKRSVALDLKDAGDRELAVDLASEADVVIENFLPGATERFGLDYATLSTGSPRLVYCTISGYGRDSRRASWPALDFVIQAHAGIMAVTGSTPAEPLKAGVPIADMASALFGTIGILAAVSQAQTTGRGAHVEVSLADACTCLLANQSMNWLLGDLEPRPGGNSHPNIAPYQTIAARDRPIALAATSDPQFEALCRVIGRDDLLNDARFATNAQRVANREVMIAELDDALGADDAATWVARLNQAGVAAAVVNSVSEALSDPDTVERLVALIPDGDRQVAQLRSPIRLDGRALEPTSAPPALGADTAAARQPDQKEIRL